MLCSNCESSVFQHIRDLGSLEIIRLFHFYLRKIVADLWLMKEQNLLQLTKTEKESFQKLSSSSEMLRDAKGRLRCTRTETPENFEKHVASSNLTMSNRQSYEGRHSCIQKLIFNCIFESLGHLKLRLSQK